MGHSSARQAIKSGSTEAATKRRATSPRMIHCLQCDKEFDLSLAGPGPKPEHCSEACKSAFRTITRTCQVCEEPFSFEVTSRKVFQHREFCSITCKMKAQRANPLSEEKFSASMKEHYAAHGGYWKGKSNPALRNWWNTASEEEKAVVNKKSAQTLRAIGHRPKMRGGNGHLTVPQILLAERTGMTTELPISTKTIRHLIPNLAKHYKADLSDKDRMLVVEIDGNSHNSVKAQARDAKKDKALSLLGWSVLRFSNQEVMENTASVVERIQSFTTSR
ncbi:endonuclease domain-containing protein [Roseicella sp. DB1501]|uniref:endonuclease domain-containing protein n=1 Tax=Roseicella sp. DB1501 TaxID=2730925 RepID=UPI0034A00ED4